MEEHAVANPGQLDLFLCEAEINPVECVDISDIDIDFGDANHMARSKI